MCTEMSCMLTHCLPTPCTWSRPGVIVSKYKGVEFRTIMPNSKITPCWPTPMFWCVILVFNLSHMIRVPMCAPIAFCGNFQIFFNESSQSYLDSFTFRSSTVFNCIIVHICSIITTVPFRAYIFTWPKIIICLRTLFIYLFYCLFYAIVWSNFLCSFLVGWGNSDIKRYFTFWFEDIHLSIKSLVLEVSASNGTGRQIVICINSMVSIAVSIIPCDHLQ